MRNMPYSKFHVIRIIVLSLLLCFLTSIVSMSALFSHSAWAAEDITSVKNSSNFGLATEELPYASTVKYSLKFRANGAVGTMEDKEVIIERGKAVITILPTATFVREGWEFVGWMPTVPSFTYLPSIMVPDKQKLINLSWQLNEKSDDWGNSITLQSFSDEDNTIQFNAVWKNVVTGQLDEGAISENSGYKEGLRRTSSTTSRALYRFTNGAHAYLTTGSSAPSGYKNKTLLCSVPASSSTPVYALTHPDLTYVWLFTTSTIEYNTRVSEGWVKRGVAFYSDDGKGIPIHRFYQASTRAHFWATNSSLSGYSYENVAFYGMKWYSIVYNGNGSTAGAMTTQSGLQYGLNYNLKANAFSKTDYHFTGWLGSDGKRYSDGQQISNLTSTPNGTITLYAQWAPDYCSIAFSANGGEGAMPSLKVRIGTDFTVPQPSFSRFGYSFSKWSTTSDGTGTLYSPGQKVKGQVNQTLYAQWTPLQVKFSVPSTIPLLMDSKGTLSTLEQKIEALKNEGSAVVQLKGLRVISNALQVVSEPESAGQCSLNLSYMPGESIPLVNYVGNEFKPLSIASQAGHIKPQSAFSLDFIEGKYVGVSLPSAGVFTAATLNWQIGVSPVSITYDANGGTGNSSVQHANEGATLYCASCNFSCEGKVFDSWNTAPDGTGIRYLPGNSFQPTTDMVLFARWK